MVLEIHGGGLQNKGAELMLRTAFDELSHRLPTTRFAVYPVDAGYGGTAPLGLYHILPGPGRQGRLALLGRGAQACAELAFPSRLSFLENNYGLVRNARLDGLVDVSGYAFSDEWGPDLAKAFAALSVTYRRRGKPVVLLPQAFGPFITASVRAHFQTIVRNAVLVFARDQESFEYALEATDQPDRVLRAPDITLFSILGDPPPPRVLRSGRPFACLVPNARVLDRGRLDADTYLLRLSEAARHLLNFDLDVLITVHSNEAADVSIAERLRQELGSERVSTALSNNALELRRLIGSASCLVGSRYHSLVAAFAQGVPSVALGWSHKYRGLYRDFGVPDLCLDSTTSSKELDVALQRVLDPDISSGLRAQFHNRLSSLAQVSEGMWELVVEALRRS
jgi:polysaccharide pyruvyl transferase WcaK-like protein